MLFCRLIATLLLLLPAFSVWAGENMSAKSFLSEKWQVANTPNTPVNDLLFETTGGDTNHHLSDWHGNWVLLNLWATWCGPCVAEMPALDALPEKFKDQKLQVVALAEDRQGEVAVPVFYKQHKLKNLGVWIDPEGRAPSQTKAHGLPTTLLINPAGQEVGRVSGAIDWLAPENIAFLQQIIRETK